ncbi:DUF6538 domain-containing protein [Magnetococcus sp. PR-3]|uniref:DUF6538 domain-containing protein n=1 Tax=Magnetococcus sp. PR-3 TaxID=3120355 RepID=UPI002FCE031D
MPRNAPSFLSQHPNGLYYCRFRLSTLLQGHFGIKEMRRSLNTAHHREALKQARKLAVFFQALEDEIMAKRGSKTTIGLITHFTFDTEGNKTGELRI